jgi:polyhydroxyalkanoate synthesis regulator phasin
MEEIKKKAIEKLRQQMEEDCLKGSRMAYEMVANGSLKLEEAEKLVETAENPVHEALAGESEDFKKCFIAALVNILSEAKSGRQTEE